MMFEILPIVMNKQFERLAVIDEYSSLIWTTRFYKVGDFELCVDIDDKTKGLFQKGFYIMREDDENVGIVEDIQITKNEDQHEMLIISGRFLPSILARRIIAQQTVVNGSISSCVNTLLNDAIVNPSIAARKIPNFKLGSYNISQTMQAQYTGDNLLEKVSEICQTYGIGFKTILNSSNEFVFSLFTGVDRSYDQSVNPYVVFSDEYDNLLSSKYVEDYKEIATNVLVAGEGEGADRKTLWVAADTNLIPNNPSYWQSGGLNDGQNVDNPTALQTRIRLISGIPVQPNTSYTITKTAGTAIGIHQMTAEGGTFVHDSLWQTGTTYTFTTEPNCTFIRICFRYDPSGNISPSVIGSSVTIKMVENDVGLDRYEVYKDQRNLQSNGGEISQADYQAQMMEAGKEALTSITTAFTGTVYFGNIEWKKDVNIGDICVIENKKWGIYINSRLIEVIESVSETGQYSIIPTFGL